MAKRYQLLFILFINLISFSLEIKDLGIIEDNQLEEQILIKPPGFSRISGFYPDNFKLKLNSEEDTTIYYTLDSTDPKTSNTSVIFKDYILIYDKTSEPNIYSSYYEDENSTVSISRGHRYKSPQFPVDKAMIVRAVAKNREGLFSDVVTKVYFVTNENLYKYQDLTIASLVTNPENLFSPDIGIYVTGTMYQQWKNSEDYDPSIKLWDKNTKCNFFMRGSEWEREAFFTIFEKGEIILQQNIGIRVKGAATRNYPQKSFNLYARKKYGKSTFETDILKNNYDINGKKITSYKSLTIRSVYDDTRLRDIMGRDLFSIRKDLTSAEMEPIVLFINGEFWGLYLIQENFNDDFIEKNYLIQKKNVALAKENGIEEGPEEEITKFLEFCEEYSKKDLSNDKIYEEIKNYLDINSLIELYATGIYIANSDWPGKNDGEWRNIGEKIEGNKYSDGKWRFIIFDLDYSMSGSFGRRNSDSFKNVVNRLERSPLNPLFLSLLINNTDFQNKFVNIFCDYANGVFNPNRVYKILEKYRNEYPELLSRTQIRWGGNRYTGDNSIMENFASYKTKFLTKLDTIYDFYVKRPNNTLQNMIDFIGLKGKLVELNIEIKGKGKVQINSIIPDLKNGKWTGNYISGIPISIKAIPEAGYYFVGWKGYIESIKQSNEIILFDFNQTVIACFD